MRQGIDVGVQSALFVLKLFSDRGKSSGDRFLALFEASHQHRASRLHFEVRNIELAQQADGKQSYHRVVLCANVARLNQSLPF